MRAGLPLLFAKVRMCLSCLLDFGALVLGWGSTPWLGGSMTYEGAKHLPTIGFAANYMVVSERRDRVGVLLNQPGVSTGVIWDRETFFGWLGQRV
jgi:hypothetical protein